MGLLIASGRLANILKRGTVTMDDEHADFPASYLYDGDPGSPASMQTARSDADIVVDGDLALGSGVFEDAFVGGKPVDWDNESISGATLVRDTVVFNSGAASCRLEASGGGTAALSRVFTCAADEFLTLKMALRGNGVDPVSVTVQDLETGQWLNPGFGINPVPFWDNAFVVLMDQTAAAFGDYEVQFEMSSLVEWPDPERRVRVRISTASSDGWVDDFAFFPHWRMAAFIGHNISPYTQVGDNIQWQKGDSASGPFTTVETITVRHNTFWHLLATMQTNRFQRFRLVGINPEAFWIGELISCQPHHFDKCAMTPVITQHIDSRIQVPRTMGGQASYGLADAIRRIKQFVFQFPDTPLTAESGFWQEWYSEFMIRAIGGSPTLLVPNEDRNEVLYGHLSPAITETDGAPGQAGYKRVEGCSFEEMALPVEI